MNSTRVKIAEFKLAQRGKEGFAVSLPTRWVRDVGLNLGDPIIIYRTPEDLLIIEVKKVSKKSKKVAKKG